MLTCDLFICLFLFSSQSRIFHSYAIYQTLEKDSGSEQLILIRLTHIEKDGSNLDIYSTVKAIEQ